MSILNRLDIIGFNRNKVGEIKIVKVKLNYFKTGKLRMKEALESLVGILFY
jgi:hypothetical protein